MQIDDNGKNPRLNGYNSDQTKADFTLYTGSVHQYMDTNNTDDYSDKHYLCGVPQDKQTQVKRRLNEIRRGLARLAQTVINPRTDNKESTNE